MSTPTLVGPALTAALYDDVRAVYDRLMSECQQAAKEAAQIDPCAYWPTYCGALQAKLFTVVVDSVLSGQGAD